MQAAHFIEVGKAKGQAIAPAGWPARGAIEFKAVSARYREGLPAVLDEVSLSIPAGCKVGVVGRTGSGKSTLCLALFRIIEPFSGSISIDGVDLRGLGLQAVRGALGCISQEPVLFEGSLRTNLDPLAAHSDAELWRALELVHLGPRAAALGEGALDQPDAVHAGGANWSAGERQLLCMGRAVLRQGAVLVMDEARGAEGTVRGFCGAQLWTHAAHLCTRFQTAPWASSERRQKSSSRAMSPRSQSTC